MATSQIVWTILPYGATGAPGERGTRRRVSVVVSPRLTPESADEQILGKFPAFVKWPDVLGGAKFSAISGGKQIGLELISKIDPDLWREFFTEDTPVAGFQYMDMSAVNLRSYSVRNMLGYVKRHYGKLAVQAASNHPSLLPWRDAHPDLKKMLSDAGTRTTVIPFGRDKVEAALPGFGRFFDESFEAVIDRQVFGPKGIYRGEVPGPAAKDEGGPASAGRKTRRAMNPDWYNPRPGGPDSPLVAQADAALMDQFRSADEYNLYQADRFYRRERPSDAERRMRRPTFENIAPPPAVPDYDFHRIVASLANYPDLLRRLGLILDFVFEDESWLEERIAAAPDGSAEGRLQLRVDWRENPGVSDVTPHTAFAADKERFVARPRGEDNERGLLRLQYSDDSHRASKGLFDIYQVDPDGAALKTVNFTLTAQNLVTRHLSLRQKHGEVTYTTGDRQGVAALRSGGLGISRHGRAVDVATAAAAATAKNDAIANGSGNDITLFAEDVHRGYRVDVAPVPDFNEAGPWHTLCARVGEYRLINSRTAIDLAPDEGYVSGASTTSGGPESDRPDDHYLHESMFRWSGWSLCAPRPGLAIKAEKVEGSEIQAEVPSAGGEVAEKGSGLVATFKTQKGTLPRLRFGQLYRFRARIVDLAGNSLTVDDPTLGKLEQASNAVGYWRFEPIDPPVIVHRTRVSEGESLERMVIRSNHDVSAKAYLDTQPFKDAIALPPSQDFGYGAVNERHLVPPKSSQQQCETHGLFDPWFGDWERIKEGYAIAAREAGTLYDALPGAEVELVTPAILDGVATTDSVPPAMPDATNPVGDRLAGGQYVIHAEKQVATPWLPDGAAGGTAIRPAPGHALPGVTEEKELGPSCVIRMTPSEQFVILIRNGEKWPDSTGCRLILAEREAAITSLPCNEEFPDDGAPVWDEEARTLTFFVPKGRVVRLVYASFADPDFIKGFGIPQWTDAGANRNFVYRTAMLGANWLITPFRDLVLVHATQAPVCEPEFVLMTPNRQLGSHDTKLFTRGIRLHGPSTGKFEIEAEWSEWVDDLAKPGPERVVHKGQLGEIKLAENHRNEFPLQQAVAAQMVDPQAQRGDVHALGDTRFRLIRYRIRATTRFREYLPPAVYAQRDAVTRLGPVAIGRAMALPPEDDAGAPVLEDQNGSDQQSFVPASAPPRDPRVLYVVPTFQWQAANNNSAKNRSVTRYGNGLRVWLDRPWFSSGDGELLGVVIFKDGGRFTDIPNAYQPLVTQWGVDPFWDSSLPKTQTKVSDFPSRVISERVHLQEKSGGGDPQVEVVGHRVHWDEARSLWYCDIEIEPGTTYTPFVRLALVRYQPNALSEAKISKVVLADFAQLLPRRRAVVKLTGSRVEAALRGPNPRSGPMLFPVDSEYQDISIIPGPHETGRNRVELVLQTRDPSIDSDLAWEDSSILASHVVGAEAKASSNGLLLEPIDLGASMRERTAIRTRMVKAVREAAVKTFETRSGGTVRLDPSIELERIPGIDIPTFELDPPFWEASVTLAPAGDRPRRLMLREFERFYSDHIQPQQAAGATRQRRVIEERLVFADIIAL